MKEEIRNNTKKQKKNLKKISNSVRKIIISAIIFTTGIFIPGSIIADTANLILSSDWSIFLAVMIKSALMVGGVMGTIIGIIDESKASNEIENAISENDELMSAMSDELEKTNEKNKSLQEELANAMNKDKNIEKIAQINNQIQQKYEYQEEEKHKIKAKRK